MTYKIISLLVPLIISSVSNIPNQISFDSPKYISSKFSFVSIDEPIIVEHYDDYFRCSTFGPFSLDTVTNNETVTFTYELNNILSQDIIERVRIFNSSNSVVSASSNASIYYRKGTRNTTSFTIRLRDYLTSNGLTLKFEIVSKSNRTVLKDYSATFYPTGDEEISWVSLKQSPHVSRSLGFYSKDSEIKPLVETLDFTHFGDYLNVDYYYRLDVNKNVIDYPNDCSFKFNNAYLIFNDNNYLFPYMSHQSTGDITIPLTAIKSDGHVYLNCKDTYYINKRTLQISDTYRNGFVTTRDFYLPVNGRSKFNGKQLFFVLEGFGLDNISTTIPIRYEASNSLVGICTDGDYCIIGGRR